MPLLQYSSAKPIVRKWGGAAAIASVSSSQLLQMTIMAGKTLQPAHATLMAKLLRFEQVLSELPSKQQLNDRCIEDFKAFMRAVVIAGKTQSILHIDP